MRPHPLENSEEEWNCTSAQRRCATHTHLPAGEYTFRLQAANDDGGWNDACTSVRIAVLPPWWQTWWAYALGALIAIGAVSWLVAWRFRTTTAARRQLESQVAERTHALGERIKELDCLYGVSGLVDQPGVSLDEILQGTVDLIPPAWQYPEITCARIVVEGREFSTGNFDTSPWQQTAAILVRGEQSGTVQVGYLRERPPLEEGPFLKEERHLIDAIAEQLGKLIERIRAEDQVREHHQFLQTALDSLVHPVCVINVHD